MRQLISQSYDFLKSEPVSRLAIVHPLLYEQKTAELLMNRNQTNDQKENQNQRKANTIN